MTSYRICTPWLGSPTSYASGYMRTHRTAAASQSLTVLFSSPPTYWIGFETRASSGSSRENKDSPAMTRQGYGCRRGSTSPDVMDALLRPPRRVVQQHVRQLVKPVVHRAAVRPQV